MLIECKIHRPGGTKVEVNGAEWHFKPDAHGRHICNVLDKKAAERFLEITEGYERARTVAEVPAELKPAAKPVPVVDLAPNVPIGVSANLDEMNRTELLAYGKSLGMPKMAASLSDEKMRLNIALFLRERAGMDEEPQPEPDTPPADSPPAETDDASDLT